MTGFDIQKEKDYVFGMMDMYPSDREVEDMLRMKGLSKEEVTAVMDSIREEGYERRIQQAKKMMIWSLVATIIAGAVYLVLFPAIYNKGDEVIERAYARMMTEPFFYITIVAMFQLAYSVYRFISYTDKLKKSRSTHSV